MFLEYIVYYSPYKIRKESKYNLTFYECLFV